LDVDFVGGVGGVGGVSNFARNRANWSLILLILFSFLFPESLSFFTKNHH
jgi:hypothetical protein